MRHRLIHLLSLCALASSAPTFASVIHVPADQPNLKAAIAAATSGDEIIVADGTYVGADNRGLTFGGKDLSVHSANGSATCIIDCEQLDRAFLFQSGETEAAVIEGLTIRNGKPASLNGGAVLVNGGAVITRPTLRHCVFQIENDHIAGQRTCLFDGPCVGRREKQQRTCMMQQHERAFQSAANSLFPFPIYRHSERAICGGELYLWVSALLCFSFCWC